MKLKITLLFFLSALFLTPSQAQCDGAKFEEKNGLVVMEAENVSLKSSWKKETSKSGFTGSGYIVWRGTQQYFSDPGNAIMTYKIKINSPGKYRFNWRSRIVKIAGAEPTKEHNDTWIKFPDADDFYGQKGSSRVYPKGSGKKPNPNGQSGEGWLKAFMNSTNWQWKAKTSDGDSHDIYVEFDSKGTYTMQISARSTGHAIDRMVLYKSGVGSSTAQSLSNKQTLCDGSTTTTNPAINSLKFVNASSDKVIGNISNGQTINLANYNGAKLTFSAVANSVTQSVKLNLSGPTSKSRTDNNVPYSVFGDSGNNYSGADLKVGSYTLTATPYSKDSASGTKGSSKSVSFKVVNNGDDPDPPSGDNKVTSFTLVNAKTGKDIGTITSGKNFPKDGLPSSLSIRANTSPSSIGKVTMSLTGPITTTKNEGDAPYHIFGDIGTSPIGRSFPKGNYQIKANPVNGAAKSINFTIGADDNPPPPPSDDKITYTLIRTSDDIAIKPIKNGTVINNGGKKNIRVNAGFTNIGSVSFKLSGPTNRTWLENKAPYALFGNNGGDYKDGFFKVGKYSLEVKVYSGSNRTGSILGTDTVSFSVGSTSSGSAKTASALGKDAYVFPNPINKDGRFSVKLPENVQGDVIYSVISSSGAEVEAGKIIVDRAGDNAEFNLNAFDNKNNGVYYLILQTGDSSFSLPIVKE